jgi:hypothetical protein
LSDPSKYTRDYSFTDYQASNPSAPLPGLQVDAELEDVEASIGEIVDAIKNVRRSDGALKNEIVTLDSLDATVRAGVGSGALASAEAAAASADAASDSAVAAAASATAASGSATAASGYASNALTSRNEADGFADDAAAAASLSATARDYAYQWSSAASGVDVNDGVNPVNKSAYHWAQVALAAAAGSVADGSITTVKLADNSVTSAKIVNGTIVTADLADGSVTSAKIVDGTIATGDIADGAITSAKIADGTVANADLANMTQATIKGRASGAGTGAPTDLDATAVYTIVAGLVAPLPKTAAGVGQIFDFNSISTGSAAALPAGGTWFYSIQRLNNSTAQWQVPSGDVGGATGIASGGTTIFTGAANVKFTGFAIRIS